MLENADIGVGAEEVCFDAARGEISCAPRRDRVCHNVSRYALAGADVPLTVRLRRLRLSFHLCVLLDPISASFSPLYYCHVQHHCSVSRFQQVCRVLL